MQVHGVTLGDDEKGFGEANAVRGAGDEDVGQSGVGRGWEGCLERNGCSGMLMEASGVTMRSGLP